MIINASTVAMGSQQELAMIHTRRESLRSWVGASGGSAATGVGPERDEARFSPAGVILGRGLPPVRTRPERQAGAGPAQAMGGRCARTGKAGQAGQDSQLSSSLEAFKATLIAKLMEMLTGRKFTVVLPPDLVDEEGMAALEEGVAQLQAVAGRLGAPGAAPSQPAASGWGVEYHAEESYLETEQTTFAAAGEVVTSDGKRLAFEVELSMSRAYLERNSIDVRAGDAALQDPLVINFGGSAARFTQTRFAFDLNLDGQMEQMAALAPGSGYLAYDRNGNGRIDDGGELFGPQSGAGFAELAGLDQDGNGWLDEADPLFQDLRIWSRDPDGQERLFALGEQGIGALYTGSVESPFRMTDANNQTTAQVRASGLYLKENGQAGTLQQLDLAV